MSDTHWTSPEGKTYPRRFNRRWRRSWIAYTRCWFDKQTRETAAASLAAKHYYYEVDQMYRLGLLYNELPAWRR